MAISVRYIVDDVDKAIAFYTQALGFTVAMHPAPSFAIVVKDDLRLLLNGTTGPGGASQPMPDGRRPEPGGWNRIHIEVANLEEEVKRLRAAGAKFRNEIVSGAGGRQILVEDPSGNPVELFEPQNR
ncbi:MAG TPA: VOC family protein [Rhizobiaceae bacterium]|nr:VOC family protein [Rhizobiaceae bacterium]